MYGILLDYMGHLKLLVVLGLQHSVQVWCVLAALFPLFSARVLTELESKSAVCGLSDLATAYRTMSPALGIYEDPLGSRASLLREC